MDLQNQNGFNIFGNQQTVGQAHDQADLGGAPPQNQSNTGGTPLDEPRFSELDRRSWQSSMEQWKQKALHLQREMEATAYREPEPQLPSEPDAPNVDEYDFSDPDQLKKYQKDQQAYLKKLSEYNKASQQAMFTPLEQIKEQQKLMEMADEVASRAFQELSAVSQLPQEVSHQLAVNYAERFVINQQPLDIREYAALEMLQSGQYELVKKGQQQFQQQQPAPPRPALPSINSFGNRQQTQQQRPDPRSALDKLRGAGLNR